MTYGRSIFKALAKFGIDPSRWHVLAADRTAWRETLRRGIAPVVFRSPPMPEPRAPSPCGPISRTKPVRGCIRATLTNIVHLLRLSA